MIKDLLSNPQLIRYEKLYYNILEKAIKIILEQLGKDSIIYMNKLDKNSVKINSIGIRENNSLIGVIGVSKDGSKIIDMSLEYLISRFKDKIYSVLAESISK